MRIAVDATVLWGSSRYSGVEKVVDRLARRLRDQVPPADIRIFVPADWCGFQESSVEDPVQRLAFRGDQRLLRILWQQFALPLELRRWQADVLFCPAYVAPLFCPCPTALFLHDTHGLRLDRTRLANYLHHRMFLCPSLRRAAGLLAPTRVVLQEADALIAPDALRSVAHLGVDPIFRPLRATVSQEDPYLLFVSNLEARKGLHLLIGALPLLSDCRLKLVIVGKDAGQRQMLERRAAELGQSHRIRFTGYVHVDELVELYRGAAALVHPALSEGFGLTPLEAMACGTPAVVVETATAREVLGDAALFCRPDSPSLAAAINSLLAQPALRSRLSEAGAQHAARFRWDCTFQVVLALIQQCAARSHGQPSGR